MAMFREGQKVTYLGDSLGREEELEIGDKGSVLQAGASGSHVLWLTGAHRGRIDLVDNLDISAVRMHEAMSELDDSLDAPLFSRVSVRDIYRNDGATGLLNFLIDQGHTAGFDEIAHDVVTHVASRIRQDPSFRAALGQLDPEDAERVVGLATNALLRDAFGEGE